MVGATRQKKKQGAPIPEGMDPTGVFEAFMQRMEHIGKNNGNNHATASRFMRDKLLERFRALRLEKFDGMADPWNAE